MDIKKKLKQYIALQREAEILRMKVAQIEDAITAPSSPNLSGMPVYHSGSKAIEDKVIAILAEKEKLLQKMYEVALEANEISELIDTLPDERMRTIMQYRYILGMKWEEVAYKCGYAWAQTHKLHSEALMILEHHTQ